METCLNKRVVVFFILLLVILSLLYSTTFHAPFNFDDEAVIKFEVAQKTTGDLYSNFYPPRYRHLFYSSLIFNYSKGQLNPFGYHLINTSLHFFTSIVIFFIAFITIQKGLSLNKKEALSIAGITTLLFSINPVHSETVNYISARAVGMSSFFYLSALLSFTLGSDFFETVRGATMNGLYGNPRVAAFFGWEGSSVEHGGYINRGFDDIGWLPKGGR